MKNIKTAGFFTLLITGLCLSSCSNKAGNKQADLPDSIKLTKLDFTVEKAPEWSKLFLRNKGWFGGDGIFALTKNGIETAGSSKKEDAIIWFSDTMFGDIINDSLLPGFGMINNSVALLQAGKTDSASISFYWDTGADGKPKSMVVPQTPATQATNYYWLGDGFVNHQKNNDLYIFGYRISNIPGVAVFGFKEVGNTLIVAANDGKMPLKSKKQIDIPFFLNKDVDSTGSFGAGLLVNTKEAGAVNPDGFLYIYGVRGKTKQVMVARVEPANIEAFDQWKFWDGKAWNKDANAIQPITDRASNELSVTPLPDGRYAMIFQLDGLGKYVGLRLGPSPYGPFGPPINVYDVSADVKDSKNLFPYNAKAHPVLSEPGELLISYNINSFDFEKDIKKFPHLYRPRFIKLKYKVE